MSKAKLVITAVVIEGREPSEVAEVYGVSRSWLYELLARYRAEGETAFEPRSRRPKTIPNATPAATAELILELRRKLHGVGLDAGPDTIRWHLDQHHGITVSRATISGHLTRAGLVVPEPKKKPKSSYIRFRAAMPNETWQSDFTHFRLADGTDVEILSWLDDCTRMAIRIAAHRRVTAKIVRDEFRQAVKMPEYRPPRSPTTAWYSPHGSPAGPAATHSKPNSNAST